MNFDFNDDQKLLRDEVRKFLQKESPLNAVRRVIDTEDTHDDKVWQGLTQMGVTTLMLPESCGGIGLGALELCLIAEEVGRQLCPIPLASTLYLATQTMLIGSSEGQQHRWLSRVAKGECACLAAPLDGDIQTSGLPRFSQGRLYGKAPLVADGQIAQWAVVLAVDDTDQLVWAVTGLDHGVTRRRLKTLDPSKPFAEWGFDGTPAEKLDAVDDARTLLSRTLDRAAVLLAFEQVGAAESALEMATAYAKERKTFGRAIGSYQGIKHKLADLYTDIQMARAHCYYGAWALAADSAHPIGAIELAAAAAAARISASRVLTHMAQENLHIHGGMGYTWELDCHLYYRRARQQAVLLGNEHAWQERLVRELESTLDRPAGSIIQVRDPAPEGSMDFDDTPAEAAFRSECRAWLDANAKPKQRAEESFGPHLSQAERMQAARDWQARKVDGGFGAITWPKSLGGRGGNPMQELIWRQEEGRYNVPTGFFNVSLGMVIPSVMAHASQEVLAAHIAPALKGKHLWCQLLSEPGAGSDLGMVRTRAERCTDGREGWILNGQKVWTSLAQFAQYGLVLARTDPSVPKYDGLTTFFIEMDSPGVTVRPIRQAGGESEFNEVFLEGVFVPDNQRVGEVGGGWKTTLTGLMNERLSIGGVMPSELWQTAAQMMRNSSLHGAPAIRDGRLRERLTDIYLNAQALWLLQCRALTALGKGQAPGPEMSGAKNIAAHTLQSFSNLAIDLQGQRGVLSSEELGEDFAMVQRLWFGSAGMRIAGGTDEMVKNSIGERVLGLPPEPRGDKGIPFNQLKA